MIEKKYAKILNDLFNARQQGDYEPLTWYDHEDTQNYYLKAKEFIERMSSLHKEILQKMN
jgi:uncharacterized protein (UPF0332 family)